MEQPRAITTDTRAILFDHDGTLIDSEAVHFDIWSQVLSPFDVELSEDFYCEVMAGIPVRQNAIDAVSHFSLDVEPAELAERKQAMTREFLKQQAFPLMPYAIQAIENCARAGFQLAIVTGGARVSVERTLDTYEVRDLFVTSVAVEDVEHSKPAPDCYLKAARELGLEPHQCVAVEDTAFGMQAAVSAGIPCVVIPTVHSQQHDFSPATARYESLQAWLKAELSWSDS